MAKEIYVSVDIEADGPIPGDNSMLNFGLAAFELDNREPIATFEANLHPLPGAKRDPDTMAWWKKQPEAWKYVTTNCREPATVMQEVVRWARKLPGKPVLVVYPTYDFMWMRWYLVHFCGAENAKVFGFQALDLKTLMMVMGEIPFKQVSKRWVSKEHPEWFKGTPKHDHTGLADAIGQGVMLINILAELRDVPLDPDMVTSQNEVLFVQDYERKWHRSADLMGMRVTCKNPIPGSPIVWRRSDGKKGPPSHERCLVCEDLWAKGKRT